MKSYIHIDGWKTNLRFSSAHIIPEYEKCGRLHGHTYAVHAKVFGKPDKKGIILDFSILKANLKKIIKTLDHKILIPEQSKNFNIEKENDSIKITSLEKKYIFPKNDCVFLPLKSTSAENLAKFIITLLLENITFPDNIELLEIGVDEGYGQGAKISKSIV